MAVEDNAKMNIEQQTDSTTVASETNENESGIPFYTEIMDAFREGKSQAELRKRYILKMIDEVWVSAIEDALPALDVIIRSPGRRLEEREEVLPVEQTRKITGRSVEHLVQHTNLINEIRDDGMVVPSKLMNIFQDETILTYENRFINTLLARVSAFVAIRYEAAEECGEDEKITNFSFNQEFTHGEEKGKISFSIEVSNPPHEHEVVKNYIYTSDLWKRVEKIQKVLSSYMSSSFVQEMGRNYVRPPIMRTNVLLKNVNFRQALALWEFLEQYENTGYESLIQDSVENIKEDYITDMYKTLVAQFYLFEKHIQEAKINGEVLDVKLTEAPIHPQIKSEVKEFDLHEYDYLAEKKEISYTTDEKAIEEAIRIALVADDLILAETEPDESEEEVEQTKPEYRYRYSFLARLVLLQNPNQEYYNVIKNTLLSYKKIKSRQSFNYETFNFGRNKACKVCLRGKTLYLYLALDPETVDKKYHTVNLNKNGKNVSLPTLIKLRSNRSLKYAKELIKLLMEKLNAVKLDNYKEVDYRPGTISLEDMIKHNPPLVKCIDDISKKLADDDDETDDEAEPIGEVEANDEAEPIGEVEANDEAEPIGEVESNDEAEPIGEVESMDETESNDEIEDSSGKESNAISKESIQFAENIFSFLQGLVDNESIEEDSDTEIENANTDAEESNE